VGCCTPSSLNFQVLVTTSILNRSKLTKRTQNLAENVHLTTLDVVSASRRGRLVGRERSSHTQTNNVFVTRYRSRCNRTVILLLFFFRFPSFDPVQRRMKKMKNIADDDNRLLIINTGKKKLFSMHSSFP
jgi:hypothetical protein